MIKKEIDYSDFENIDIRLGTIIKAEEIDKLRKPSILPQDSPGIEHTSQSGNNF